MLRAVFIFISFLPLMSCSHGLIERKIASHKDCFTNTARLSAGRKFVFGLEDFELHIRLHRQRVMTLGLEVFEKYPNAFPSINKAQVIEFLSLHDMAKIDPVLTPAKYQASFLQMLYRYYGLPRNLLSQAQQKTMDEVIHELNKADRALVLRYFQESGLLGFNNEPLAPARELLLIEKLVDLIDREMNPVSSEEFARKMRPASDFLNKDFERAMARSLKNRYFDLIDQELMLP